MGTNTTESECEKCGGVSWFMALLSDIGGER